MSHTDTSYHHQTHRYADLTSKEVSRATGEAIDRYINTQLTYKPEPAAVTVEQVKTLLDEMRKGLVEDVMQQVCDEIARLEDFIRSRT